MVPLDKSLEVMRERHARELAELEKSYRLKRWSLSGFLTAWALYVLILPFTTSPDQVIVMFSIFVIFLVQFIYVGMLD